MSTGLNIKDPEAHRLALAISSQTGQPMTRVVVEALRESLVRLQRSRDRASLPELMDISVRSSRLISSPHPPHAELLYDGNGLPK